MDTVAQMACWEIMGCGRKDACPTWLQAPTPCWEIVSEMDDYRNALNVCADCVVYVLNHDATVFSEHELNCIKARNSTCCATPAGCRRQQQPAV